MPSRAFFQAALDKIAGDEPQPKPMDDWGNWEPLDFGRGTPPAAQPPAPAATPAAKPATAEGAPAKPAPAPEAPVAEPPAPAAAKAEAGGQSPGAQETFGGLINNAKRLWTDHPIAAPVVGGALAVGGATTATGKALVGAGKDAWNASTAKRVWDAGKNLVGGKAKSSLNKFEAAGQRAQAEASGVESAGESAARMQGESGLSPAPRAAAKPLGPVPQNAREIAAARNARWANVQASKAAPKPAPATASESAIGARSAAPAEIPAGDIAAMRNAYGDAAAQKGFANLGAASAVENAAARGASALARVAPAAMEAGNIAGAGVAGYDIGKATLAPGTTAGDYWSQTRAGQAAGRGTTNLAARLNRSPVGNALMNQASGKLEQADATMNAASKGFGLMAPVINAANPATQLSALRHPVQAAKDFGGEMRGAWNSFTTAAGNAARIGARELMRDPLTGTATYNPATPWAEGRTTQSAAPQKPAAAPAARPPQVPWLRQKLMNTPGWK